MKYFEANFDGLVGPTHNYAGLSQGNIASIKNAKARSNPKKAAKQGLSKAKFLSDLGLVQGLLAPHERPCFRALRQLGFTGTDKQIIEKVYKQSKELLAACYSSSAMWTANAATISPSCDSLDSKVHITAANLSDQFHRSLEPDFTAEVLRKTFVDPSLFTHHQHLPMGTHFGDEGAANHTRFCSNYADHGVQLFVFGKYSFNHKKQKPLKFRARQSYEASQAIARLHQLREEKTIFIQQNPKVIDQGVFHNDVIAVGNRNVLFYHEQAFLENSKLKTEINKHFKSGPKFHFIKVGTKEVSVKDAVESYLFNSQLISLTDDKMTILVPNECKLNKKVWKYLTKLTESKKTPLQQVDVFDIKESMRNGGGPACLRLRVVLSEAELKGVNPKTLINQEQFTKLNSWVDKHYRDRLYPQDLADPLLLDESRRALDELTQILALGSIYPFQK